MNFVLRRSLPSLGGLVGLLMAVGFLAVATVGFPLWFPVVLAIVVILVQYGINPFIIEWLVPAVVVGHDGERYALEHPLCESVARRCKQAGIPLVKLAIVDDGTPNAFTFGRTPRDARMFVTRGLIERLDDTELDAVVAHEVGHIKNWDFAVMTVAAVVPMVLYLLYLTTRSSRDARHVAIGAYAAYVVSQFIVLALSRAREYGADHWSCECTGNGDALASALVKIAYGMGRVSADEKEQVAALVARGKEGAAAARELQARAAAGPGRCGPWASSNRSRPRPWPTPSPPGSTRPGPSPPCAGTPSTRGPRCSRSCRRTPSWSTGSEPSKNRGSPARRPVSLCCG